MDFFFKSKVYCVKLVHVIYCISREPFVVFFVFVFFFNFIIIIFLFLSMDLDAILDTILNGAFNL